MPLYVHTVPVVKRSVAESVPDRAFVHTRNAAFEAVSALEQYCCALLLQGWIGMYTSVVPSLSTKFIKNSHQNLPV